MVKSAEIPAQPQTQSAQAQFLATLGTRLVALDAAVTGLESDPGSSEQRALLRRRLDAMSETATLLGFESIGAAFASAENTLAQVADALSVRDLEVLRGTLELVPSLVPEHLHDATAATSHGLQDLGPKKVVCLGLLSQQSKVNQALEGLTNIASHFTVDLEDAVSLVEKYQPDVVLIDARRIDLSVSLQRLRVLAPCAIVEANSEQLSHLPRQGVSLVSALGERYENALHRALSANHPPLPPPPRDEYSVDELVRDLGEQLQEGLLDSVRRGDPRQSIRLNKYAEVQSALWTTVARVRELISECSGGNIEYDDRGPGGALMIAGDGHSRGPRGAASLDNLKGRKVLVVDDDPAIAWFLTGVLRTAGAEVLEADNGTSAWEIAKSEYPDLIISDVVMPGLDGFGLCRNLKRDIALRDVPVVLLSWKEDLLQRVRELGVGADFYLAKETDAPVIVQRCAEALQPVARIASRLAADKVVYGRLDGLTPGQVLQLACQHAGNARVSLHDAAFTYEAYTGDRRLLALSRVSKEGARDRGEMVIPGLLGMRAGRFVIERTSGLVQAEFCGGLDDVFAPHIQRARVALRHVQGPALHGVSELCLDGAALRPYKLASPAIVSQLVEKLETGMPPAELLRSVSATLLESVLVDLASRGCIVAALGQQGEDLLLAGTSAAPELFDVAVRTPSLGHAVLAAKGAPLVGARSSERDSQKAAEFAQNLYERISESQKPPDVGIGDPVACPAAAPVLLRRVTEADAIDMAEVLLDACSASPAAPAVQVARPSSTPPKPPGYSPPKSSGKTAAASTSQPVRRPATATSERREAPQQREELCAKSLGPAAAPASGSLVAPTKPTSARPSERVVWSQRLASQVEQLGHWLTRESDSETPPLAETVTATAGHSPPNAELKAVDAPPSPGHRAAAQGSPASNDDSTRPPQACNSSSEPGETALQPKLGEPAAATRLRRLDLPGLAGALPGAQAAANKAVKLAGPAMIASCTAFGVYSFVSGLTGAAVSGSGAPAATTPAPPALETTTEMTGEEDDLSRPQSGEVATSSDSFSQTELPMPSGVRVTPEKGLLEIDTGGKHKIYVGDVFVGRGPVRRVPLIAGVQSVKVRLDGTVQTIDARIVAGKRTRVESAKSGTQAALGQK